MNYHNKFWAKPPPIPNPKAVQCVLHIQHTDGGTDLKQQPIMLSFYTPYANSHKMTANHRCQTELCQQGLTSLFHHTSPCDRKVKLTVKRRLFIAKQIPVHNTICVTSNKLRAEFLNAEGFTGRELKYSGIRNSELEHCAMFPAEFFITSVSNPHYESSQAFFRAKLMNLSHFNRLEKNNFDIMWNKQTETFTVRTEHSRGFLHVNYKTNKQFQEVFVKPASLLHMGYFRSYKSCVNVLFRGQKTSNTTTKRNSVHALTW